MHLTLPTGKAVTDIGKYVVILKRTQGQWKAAYVIYNTDAAPAPGRGDHGHD